MFNIASKKKTMWNRLGHKFVKIMRDICIYTNFLFVLTNLKNKLVEKYLEYKFSKNNSKELSKNLKQIVPKASRQFIE